jgi:hypothetical protein
MFYVAFDMRSDSFRQILTKDAARVGRLGVGSIVGRCPSNLGTPLNPQFIGLASSFYILHAMLSFHRTKNQISLSADHIRPHFKRMLARMTVVFWKYI